MGTLNLELIEEIKSEWVLLRAGNCKIALHKAGTEFQKTPEKEFKVDSNTKLVFEIDDDIFKVREILIKDNVALKEIKTFDNYDYWLCDGEDPEGKVFQLKQRKQD